MMLILMMILMMIMIAKPSDYVDGTDVDNDRKKASYTSAAAPGASVPCSLFSIILLRHGITLEFKTQGFDQTHQFFKNSRFS